VKKPMMSWVMPGGAKLVNPECKIEFTADHECFFVVNGQRMAKRENKHWVPLVPGFEMHDNLHGGSIDDLDNCQGATEH
jgi:hypothetical protein